MSLVTDDEVYSSLAFQQYLLILDEHAAFYYARQELEEERKRALLASASIPYKEWFRRYLRTPEWRAPAEATKARFGGRCALCDTTENLEAHHRTYERVGNELPEISLHCALTVTAPTTAGDSGWMTA